MFRRVEVRRGFRVALIQDGAFVRLFGPGVHWPWLGSGVHELLSLDLSAELKALPDNDPLPEDLPGARIILVAPHERVAVLVRGICRIILPPGRYRWWEEQGEPTLLRFDLREPPAPLDPADPLPQTSGLYSVTFFNEPALLLRRARPIGVVPEGRYRVWTGGEWSLRAIPHELSPVGVEAEQEPPAGRELIEVGPHERITVFHRGVFLAAKGPGRYAWWSPLGPLAVTRHDTREAPAPLQPDDPLPPGPLAGAWEEASATEQQALVLVRDGQPERALTPGRYRAWTGSRWSLKPVPLSLQTLDVAPQDLLCADQVPVRVKAAVSVRVTDPVRVLQQPDWPNQVYLAVQLALREVVTARALEALLGERESCGAELLERARARLPEVGISLELAAVKDIILPGEIKDLLNRVTLAKKEAEALSIKRREETASTRQLANTARLLESNPVLLRLKELEALGEIAARIDRITLVGSGDMVKSVLLSDLAKEGKQEL